MEVFASFKKGWEPLP